MKSKISLNDNVFNSPKNPLFTREHASDRIIYNTFSTVQTNTPLWTPSAGKKIFLTAMQISALSPLTVTFEKANNEPFMSIVMTAEMATYSETFSSPVVFDVNEAISISTNAAGTVNITLFGYED